MGTEETFGTRLQYLKAIQTFQEIVLIHELNFTESLLIFNMLLPYEVNLCAELPRPVACSPPEVTKRGITG